MNRLITSFLAVICAQWGVSEVYAQAPDPEAQLILDTSTIPVGMGAFFVPSLTSQSATFTVTRDGGRVAIGDSGRRVILPPGHYEITLNSTQTKVRPRTTVEVKEGSTTVVDPFFAAFRLESVDTGSGQRLSTSWQLFQDGEKVHSGSTDDSSQGRFVFLKPGEFELGLDNQDTTIALNSAPGQAIDYRVTLDDGKFQRAEFAKEPIEVDEKWWRLRWTVGADVAFNSSRNQLSNFNGEYMQLGVFTNAEVGIDVNNHLAVLDFGIDEAWVGLSSQYGASVPNRKLVDEARASIMYNYRLGGIVGPYVNGGVRTSIFETRFYAEEGTTIQREGEANTTVAAGQELTLINGFSPTYFNEGAGLQITAVDNEVVNIGVRGGVGLRQHRFDGGDYVDRFAPRTLRLVRLQDEDLMGLEGTAQVGLRLAHSFRIKASFDLFVPDDQVIDGEDFEPLYRLTGLAEVSINSFLSVVYRASFAKPTLQTPRSDFHGLSLRIQHTLF